MTPDEAIEILKNVPEFTKVSLTLEHGSPLVNLDPGNPFGIQQAQRHWSQINSSVGFVSGQPAPESQPNPHDFQGNNVMPNSVNDYIDFQRRKYGDQKGMK